MVNDSEVDFRGARQLSNATEIFEYNLLFVFQSWSINAASVYRRIIYCWE